MSVKIHDYIDGDRNIIEVCESVSDATAYFLSMAYEADAPELLRYHAIISDAQTGSPLAIIHYQDATEVSGMPLCIVTDLLAGIRRSYRYVEPTEESGVYSVEMCGPALELV